MKKLFLLTIAVCVSFFASSQNVIEQLNNSIERAFGGSGAEVEYHLYLTPTNIKVIHAYDWEKGEVTAGENGSQYFELTRKKNDETESMAINLENVAYIELEVKTVKGKKEFNYKFYF